MELEVFGLEFSARRDLAGAWFSRDAEDRRAVVGSTGDRFGLVNVMDGVAPTP